MLELENHKWAPHQNIRPSAVISHQKAFGMESEPEPEPETKTYFQRYLDVCFERICKTKLVKDVIILNRAGIPLRSTFSDREVCIQQAGLYSSLFDKACGLISSTDATDEFLLLTVKTRHNEVVVSVDPEHGLVVVVVQKQPE